MLTTETATTFASDVPATADPSPMPCNCGDSALHLTHAKTGEHAFICASPVCPTATDWFAAKSHAAMAWEMHGVLTTH